MKQGLCNSNRLLLIHSAAYLCKLVRSLGLLTTKWHDMGFFIASQLDRGAFLPKQASSPKCTPKALRSFYQSAIGLNAKARHKLGLHARPKLFEQGRAIDPGIGFAAQVHIRIADEKQTNVLASPAKIVEIFLHELASQAQSAEKPAGSCASPASQSFSPSELLTTFKKSFLQDEAALNFDYFRFWAECGDLMHDIEAAIVKECPAYENECGGIPSFVAWVVLSEAATGKHHPQWSGKSTSEVVAQVIAQHIGGKTNKFSKATYDQCSGRLPKHKWPQRTKADEEMQELQMFKAYELARAGCSFSMTRPITAVYHPRLTYDMMKSHELVKSAKGGIVLPRALLHDTNFEVGMPEEEFDVVHDERVEMDDMT